MNKLKWLVIFLFFFILACKSSQDTGVELSVDFSWEEVHRHGDYNRSPEIKVTNIPDGTKYFEVTLVDLNARGWPHGGGTVENDDSGIIPAGALKDRYNGPWPGVGTHHRYRFTVRALNAEGKIIGEGKATEILGSIPR